MEKLIVKFVILCSLYTSTFASTKSVFIHDNSSRQLYTSSILTWEAFGDDTNKFKHAVSGGQFVENVS
jgi:hypothetical protein